MSIEEKRSKPKNIVVIVGKDKEVVDFKSSRLVENNKKLKLQPKIIRLNEASIDEVIAEYEQGSLFGRSEFIWVKDADKIKEKDFEKLKTAVSIDNGKKMVITAHEADGSAIERWKELSSFEHVLVAAIEKTGLELYLKEIIKFAKQSGFEISAKAASTLINKCYGSFSRAVSELEKLMLYKYDSRRIDEADVIAFVEVIPEVQVFDFINQLLFRDFKNALKTLHLILESGEKPEAVFYVLLSQLNLFVAAAVYFKAGLSLKKVSENLGLQMWQLNKYMRAAQKWKWSEIVEAYWSILKIDSKLKSGFYRDYALAIKLFVAEILLTDKASVRA